MIFNNSKYNIDWSVKTLNQLGEFNRGKSKHRPRNDISLFVNGKYPFIQTGDIKAANLFIQNHTEMYNNIGLKQSKIWPKDTLCITIAANIAETALLGYPMCFPDSVVGFNAFPNESSEIFMHYVFTYIKKSIQNSASGSIQDNINIDYLTRLKFRIPKKDYQNKIAEALSILDTKIDLNNRISATLEAIAKTLYDYWFVQFDFADKNHKPYKTNGGKMVWNAPLGREIPHGWDVCKLDDLGYFKNGINYDPAILGDTEAKIINVRNISNSNWLISQYELDTITLTGTDVKNYLITVNDILIARSGIPGATRIMHEYEPNTIYCGFIIRYQVKEFCNKNYLFFSLKNLEKQTTSKSAGTIMQNVNQDTLKGMLVVFPNNDVISAFNNLISPIFKKIHANLTENKKLTDLRDWLLPMLMNGQVKVAEKSQTTLKQHPPIFKQNIT